MGVKSKLIKNSILPSQGILHFLFKRDVTDFVSYPDSEYHSSEVIKQINHTHGSILLVQGANTSCDRES